MSTKKPHPTNMAEEWASFVDAVMPLGSSQVQRTEMRRAFYAGGIACFTLLNEYTDDEEDEGCKRIVALSAEFARYAVDLRSGRA